MYYGIGQNIERLLISVVVCILLPIDVCGVVPTVDSDQHWLHNGEQVLYFLE